jgi:hypothetical protein
MSLLPPQADTKAMCEAAIRKGKRPAVSAPSFRSGYHPHVRQARYFAAGCSFLRLCCELRVPRVDSIGQLHKIEAAVLEEFAVYKVRSRGARHHYHQCNGRRSSEWWHEQSQAPKNLDSTYHVPDAVG